jgi:hypothetical protein
MAVIYTPLGEPNGFKANIGKEVQFAQVIEIKNSGKGSSGSCDKSKKKKKKS